MYRKQVRRRRAVLIGLIVCAVTLLSLYFQEGSSGPLHSGQGIVSTVLGPVEEGLSRALKPARDLVNWFGETFDARGENERLRDEVADLRSRLAEAETRRRLAGEVAGLDRITGGLVPSGYSPVTARVIGRSPTVWYSSVVVDKGSSAGVRLGDAVVASGGLAGRVTSLTRGNAQVTLIADSDSSIAARVVPIGTTGVVEPEVGDPQRLQLGFIREGEAIRKGQLVVTAGFTDPALSTRIPPGVPVARVQDVSLEEIQAYQRVQLRALADLRDMELVRVLTTPESRGERGGAR